MRGSASGCIAKGGGAKGCGPSLVGALQKGAVTCRRTCHAAVRAPVGRDTRGRDPPARHECRGGRPRGRAAIWAAEVGHPPLAGRCPGKGRRGEEGRGGAGRQALTSSRTLTTSYSALRELRMESILWEKPHWGSVRVPLMKATTRFCLTTMSMSCSTVTDRSFMPLPGVSLMSGLLTRLRAVHLVSPGLFPGGTSPSASICCSVGRKGSSGTAGERGRRVVWVEGGWGDGER